MFVSRDRGACAVLRCVESRLLACAHRAVTQVARLHLVDVLLLPLELTGFACRQLARLQAIFDALLLVHVTLLILLHRLRKRSRAQKSRGNDSHTHCGCFHGALRYAKFS
jgi:hypothetical protein